MGSEARTGRSRAELVSGVERIGKLAEDPDRLAVADGTVSGWSVGQHVEHLWLVEDRILGWIAGTLDDPAGSARGGSPLPIGGVVLVGGWIPRGRAKAPEMTEPGPTEPADVTGRCEALLDVLAGLEPRLSEIHRSECTLGHPLLGHFTPAQWMRFLDIHHRHHEKIIRDIAE